MHEPGYSRRTVLLGAMAMPFAWGLVARAESAPEEAPPVFGDGLAGGGTLETGAGEAEFSLAAFARDRGDGAADYIGTFSLRDASDPENPLEMTTDWLSGYSAPDEAKPGFRRVIGWGRANDSGPFPYVIDVEMDGDGRASGAIVTVLFGETASILLGMGKEKVCDCGGYDYRVKGTVAHGGVALFEIPAAGG